MQRYDQLNTPHGSTMIEDAYGDYYEVEEVDQKIYELEEEIKRLKFLLEKIGTVLGDV